MPPRTSVDAMEHRINCQAPLNGDNTKMHYLSECQCGHLSTLKAYRSCYQCWPLPRSPALDKCSIPEWLSRDECKPTHCRHQQQTAFSGAQFSVCFPPRHLLLQVLQVESSAHCKPKMSRGLVTVNVHCRDDIGVMTHSTTIKLRIMNPNQGPIAAGHPWRLPADAHILVPISVRNSPDPRPSAMLQFAALHPIAAQGIVQ